MPPYLAGREEEQRLFRALLDDLRDGVPLASEVILYGPRGNGKTVLLRWLRNEAGSAGIEAKTLRPSEISDAKRLAGELAPTSWWRRLAPGQLGAAGFSWTGSTEREKQPGPTELLAARARKAPLLVVMDEAHTLDLEVGRALLNASQEVRQEYPFLLVLAGTPNLRGHLSAMGASFWNRMEKIRIGRLDEAATTEALRRPFAAAGMAVDEGGLARMVRKSHGYPYFVQLLGRQVWMEIKESDGPPRVTEAALERAEPRFERAKRDCCFDRYVELEEADLLSVGRAVARAFEEGPTLTTPRLHRAIEFGLAAPTPSGVARAQGLLADLGFNWRKSPTPLWEPGIPSLMDYVLEFAPAP